MQRHVLSRPRLGVVAVAGLALVGAMTLTAPASSAPDPSCPTAVAASSLTPGDAVHGLTVTEGTTPDTFTGTFKGVLEDGIAPGVDMVLVDLHSTTIDKVGIWQGMSGSPVYDAGGDLIGAVSYGLSVGPSTIAGVTPATEMAKLLGGAGPTAKAQAKHVALPRTLARSLVASGAATPGEVSQGLTQLRLPFSVSGVTAPRLAKLARVLHFGAGHPLATTPGATSEEQIPVVAGGNLAASLSYGTVAAAGVGTATMVCGDQVVGFGHPMNYSGPATLSMHGARAVLIQDDPTVAGFKLANLGAPIGRIDNDRLAGVHGVTGALPASSVITSTATGSSGTFSGTTHVTVPDVVTDIDFANLVGVQDRVFDRIAKGTASAGWTIRGHRADGTPFRLIRTDLYSDPYDVSASSGFALAEDLATIQGYEGEVVKIASVNTDTHISGFYMPYVISKVAARTHGRWVTLSRNRATPLRAGTIARLRVSIDSRYGAPRTAAVRVHVPKHAANRVGVLTVVGGNNGVSDSEEFFDEGDLDFAPLPPASAFPKLLARMTAAPQHNQMRATLTFRGAPAPANVPRVSTRTVNRVVSGYVAAPVVAVP